MPCTHVLYWVLPPTTIPTTSLHPSMVGFPFAHLLSYSPCLQHGPVALASSQTQLHFVQLGPCISNSNAKSQTQPHFVWLGLCISNSMLSPRPNLTLFS
ncbi:hypothetical protein E4T56_gene18940 [Termitomyces sp. T112]|nr:hypothetical protein E4T56_gene18940 [Termitomyces sp. T112]